MMNIKELMEELENYGDRVEVTVLVDDPDRNREYEYYIDDIDFHSDRVQIVVNRKI